MVRDGKTAMNAIGAAVLAVVAAVGLGGGPTLAAAARTTPYWASLSAGQAKMRSGPGRNYPADWLYQRQGLPVQVIKVIPGWRKVRDPEGTEGWMIGNLVSDQRTGMIKDAVADLRDGPNPGAKILWRAEPGVIGRLDKCSGGWCRLDVHGRDGYVEQAHLWGVDPGETTN